MNKELKKQLKKVRRKARVNIIGSTQRPRLSVFRSLSHIYVQVIDDSIGKTLVSARDFDIEKNNRKGKTKTELSKEVGKLVAKRALEKGINKVVFDRGSFLFHGRVRSLAEGAKEGGLQF